MDYRKSADADFNTRAAEVKKFVDAAKPKKGHWEGNTPKGWTETFLRDLPEIVQSVEHLRIGSKEEAATDLTLGMYCAERYGIATDAMGSSDNLFRMLGLDKKNLTLSSFHRSTKINFTTLPELNKNFEWLIGEVVTEALRAGLLQRGVYRRLIESQETVPYDSIKIPVYKRPNGRWRQYKEGATIKMSTMEFDEIAVEAKDIAQGFRLTDKVVRNVKINMLQSFIMGIVGQQLDDQLTFAAIQRLINGNVTGVDGAAVVGVLTPGSIDYDNDWLEMAIGMAELGYRADTILGVRKMIKKAMALPEFKGFNGQTVKADVVLDVPLPMDYRFIPTGAMPQPSPSGGQLLFIDPRFAMKLYTTKPVSIESERLIRELTTETVASMCFAFIKQFNDASMILDSTVNITANPFPTELDAETYQAQSF
jgi:hypothetical protein